MGPCGDLVKGGAICLADHHMLTSSWGVRTSPGVRSMRMRADIHTSLAKRRIGADVNLKRGWDEGDTVRRHMFLGTSIGRLANVAAALEVRAVMCLGCGW